MRRLIFLCFWLALVGRGICQSVIPLPFDPYEGPTVVYPDTIVTFAVAADPSSEFNLLAAPANSQIVTASATGREPDNEGRITWHTPSQTAVGATNVFIIGATTCYDSQLMTETCTVSFVVINLPPISSITLSNKFPMLVFTNAIPELTNDPPFGDSFGQGYIIQTADNLFTTNWCLLARVSSIDPAISVTDTNPPALQCFYKLIPDGGWNYDPYVLGP